MSSKMALETHLLKTKTILNAKQLVSRMAKVSSNYLSNLVPRSMEEVSKENHPNNSLKLYLF